MANRISLLSTVCTCITRDNYTWQDSGTFRTFLYALYNIDFYHFCQSGIYTHQLFYNVIILASLCAAFRLPPYTTDVQCIYDIVQMKFNSCDICCKIIYSNSSQSQSSTGDLGGFIGIEGQSGKNMCQGGKPDTGKFHSSYIGINVCGSTYENGCVVDGTCATAAD